MKTLLLTFLILSGCTHDELVVYRLAKNHPDSRVCYSVHEPKELSGRYCLQYQKETK